MIRLPLQRHRRKQPAYLLFACLSCLVLGLLSVLVYLEPDTWSWHARVLQQKTTSFFSRTVCPDPFLPTLPVNGQLGDVRTTCQPVSSSDSKFHVEICPVNLACNSFSVRISECDRLESMEPPTNEGADTTGWMKYQQGPDSFMLRTSGAQRWVDESSVYEGSCSSRFDVSLSNGGAVWLELWFRFTVSRSVTFQRKLIGLRTISTTI
jgi:hypothetical protein